MAARILSVDGNTGSQGEPKGLSQWNPDGRGPQVVLIPGSARVATPRWRGA